MKLVAHSTFWLPPELWMRGVKSVRELILMVAENKQGKPWGESKP
jgi:hypothetical protein